MFESEKICTALKQPTPTPTHVVWHSFFLVLICAHICLSISVRSTEVPSKLLLINITEYSGSSSRSSSRRSSRRRSSNDNHRRRIKPLGPCHFL